MLKIVTKSLVLATLCFSATSVFAQNDVWQERQRLQHIKTEIEALKVLVKHSEIAKVKDQRAKFQYHVLTKDLDAIIDGIEHHLSKPFEVQKPQLKNKAVGENYTTYSVEN